MSSSPLVGMTDRSSSNPLKSLERVKGIEPSSSAWKAVALPLSYTRIRPYLSRFGGHRSRTPRSAHANSQPACRLGKAARAGP